MISDEQRRHIAIVRELAMPGGALDARGPNSTKNNPAWFRPDGSARAGRRALHTRLKQEIRDKFPRAEQGNQALVLAGPPGAGKGRVSEKALGDAHSTYVNVDADEFKKLLLREAIADGSYESWIKPDAVHDLEQAGERFYPLELASLVHEESSMLSVQLRQDLIATGTNLVVDTVLSNEASATELGKQFTASNYRVAVIDVEVPYQVSEARIVQRWQDAMRDAELGKPGELGGRWVPSTYARPLFETEHGRSKSQDVAAGFAETCRGVERYERHFTSWEEHAAALQEKREAVPVLEVVKTRSRSGASLEVSHDRDMQQGSHPGRAERERDAPKRGLGQMIAQARAKRESDLPSSKSLTERGSQDREGPTR